MASPSPEITLTATAVTRIVDQLQHRGHGLGVRLGVRKTGCSGLAYTMEFVDQSVEDDLMLMVNDDYALYIDPKAYQYLKRCQIDYVKQGLNEGFEFVNPNEAARCGCGESFTVSA